MRSVLGGFAMNIGAFHEAGGAGYRLLAETVIALNGFNPQMAARMLGGEAGGGRADGDGRGEVVGGECQNMALRCKRRFK